MLLRRHREGKAEEVWVWWASGQKHHGWDTGKRGQGPGRGESGGGIGMAVTECRYCS